jgi:hypothetical protein
MFLSEQYCGYAGLGSTPMTVKQESQIGRAMSSIRPSSREGTGILLQMGCMYVSSVVPCQSCSLPSFQTLKSSICAPPWCFASLPASCRSHHLDNQQRELCGAVFSIRPGGLLAPSMWP